MSAVDEKKGVITKPKIVQYAEVARGYTYFEENDVLFAKITPCMENGKHAIARNLIDGIGFGSTEFHVLRPKKDIIPEWIWYFVRQKQFLQEAATHFTGAVGQQRLPESFLANYLLPIPPLSEQKRIVERIEELMQEVDKARKACEQQLAAVKALPSAYLREVFESKEAKRWNRERLGEVCEIFSGSPAPQEKKYFEEGKYPFVRVKDLGKHGWTTNLNETDDFINDLAIRELKLVRAPKGTILFPRSGAAIATNSRAILGIDAYIVSHLAAIKPIDQRANQYFVYYWLCTVDMTQYMENPGYPSLKLSTISHIPIPIPPLTEQKRIVDYLNEKMAQIEKLRTAIEKQWLVINALPQAILKKAFRGEL
jgi:type I restriction enzyme S subunit